MTHSLYTSKASCVNTVSGKMYQGDTSGPLLWEDPPHSPWHCGWLGEKGGKGQGQPRGETGSRCGVRAVEEPEGLGEGLRTQEVSSQSFLPS